MAVAIVFFTFLSAISGLALAANSFPFLDFISRAEEKQSFSNGEQNKEAPFRVSSVAPSALMLPVLGGFNIDGNVPDAGTINFPDPFGAVDELGAVNSNETKLVTINSATIPMLEFTNPNAQTDLRNIWMKTNTDINGKVWLYFAWERDSSNGSGVILYEFQQADRPANCDYSGIDQVLPETQAETDLIANCNPWANRQPGDFVIVWDQQGQTINIIKRTFGFNDVNPNNGVWDGPAAEPLTLDAGTTLNGTVSAADVSDDGFFGEAVINLTDTIFPPTPTSCFTIANIIPGTLTGNSDTADFKDTVFADFSSIFISNCGAVKVIKATDPPGETGSFPFTLEQDDGQTINYDGDFSFSDTLTSDGDFRQYEDLIADSDYKLTENLTDPAWALQSIVCDGVNVTNGTFSVVAGEITNCTINNKLQTGTLTVIKHVVNDNGGTNTASDFTIFLNDADNNSAAGAESPGTKYTLTNGTTFDISETGPTNLYDAAFEGHCSGTIETDVDMVCTITNDDKAPSLTLNKIVVNDNGGTALESAWTLSASGPTPISGPGAAGNADVVSGASFDAGTYTLSESGGPSGYAASDWSCVGGTQNGDQITLALGESATCTITNNDIQPKLTVTKIVVNDNGGSAVVGDFPLFVDETGVTSGIENGFDAGNYTVSETNQSGYSAVIGGDCAADGSVTLNVGDSKSCTITNDDIQPKLTVTKIVINDNGGTAVVGDFPLNVSGNAVVSGVQNGFNAGDYSVGETNLTGYTAAIGGDCAADGSITLAVGDEKSCTITNDDVQPTLKLVKTVINDNGGTAVVSDFPLFINGNSVTSGATNPLLANVLYTATETTQPGYAASVWGGDCAADGTITLQPGDAKTCTITNNDISPTLTVIKYIVPDTDSGLFNLLIDGVPYAANVGNGGTTGAVPVNAGIVHTVSETAGTDTVLSDYVTAIGGNCAANGSITLALAENKICTITNTKKGMAQIVKTVSGGLPAGGQSFTFQIRQGASSTQNGTILETKTTDANGDLTFDTKLVPGETYQICESNLLPGWMTNLGDFVPENFIPPDGVVINPNVDNSTLCGNFTVDPGETRVFTVDNTPPPGGRALTIGYWKNWSSCSTGNQLPTLDITLAMSEPNGISIGDLVLHGDITNYNLSPDCEKARNILDKRRIDNGRKMASDPAFDLAAQLLAANLNIVAGAGYDACVISTINQAQMYLDDLNFNGKTHSTINKQTGAILNNLANKLDRYNNNLPISCP